MEKKECPTCKGKKRVGGHYTEEWQNVGMCPLDGAYVTVWKDKECEECKGRGFLELKWV